MVSSPAGKKAAHFKKTPVYEEEEDLEDADSDIITENNSPNSNTRGTRRATNRQELNSQENLNETMNLKVKRNLKDLKALDINERTILHRAALEQNYQLINEILLDFESFHREKNSEDPERLLKEYVNELDMFGNSPLINACSQQYDYSNEKRKNCINLLLKAGATPKIRNKRTRWSCIYWLCFYGDSDSIDALVKNDLIPRMDSKTHLIGENLAEPPKLKIQLAKPDYMGFYPLDLAGKKVLQMKYSNLYIYINLKIVLIFSNDIIPLLEIQKGCKHYHQRTPSRFG